MAADQDKIEAFDAPDITQVDPLQIQYFSARAPSYRIISSGLNLQGSCKNSQCCAYQKLVWTPFGYGTFNIGEIIRKCKCPICGKYTKGNKMFGLYKSELSGYGMKKPDRKKSETSTNCHGADTDDEQQYEEAKEIKFQKIVCQTEDGFLKMDGKNGKITKWYYMTLTIKKLPKAK